MYFATCIKHEGVSTRQSRGYVSTLDGLEMSWRGWTREVKCMEENQPVPSEYRRTLSCSSRKSREIQGFHSRCPEKQQISATGCLQEQSFLFSGNVMSNIIVQQLPNTKNSWFCVHQAPCTVLFVGSFQLSRMLSGELPKQ